MNMIVLYNKFIYENCYIVALFVLLVFVVLNYLKKYIDNIFYYVGFWKCIPLKKTFSLIGFLSKNTTLSNKIIFSILFLVVFYSYFGVGSYFCNSLQVSTIYFLFIYTEIFVILQTGIFMYLFNKKEPIFNPIIIQKNLKTKIFVLYYYFLSNIATFITKSNFFWCIICLILYLTYYFPVSSLFFLNLIFFSWLYAINIMAAAIMSYIFAKIKFSRNIIDTYFNIYYINNMEINTLTAQLQRALGLSLGSLGMLFVTDTGMTVVNAADVVVTSSIKKYMGMEPLTEVEKIAKMQREFPLRSWFNIAQNFAKSLEKK